MNGIKCRGQTFVGDGERYSWAAGHLHTGLVRQGRDRGGNLSIPSALPQAQSAVLRPAENSGLRIRSTLICSFTQIAQIRAGNWLICSLLKKLWLNSIKEDKTIITNSNQFQEVELQVQFSSNKFLALVTDINKIIKQTIIKIWYRIEEMFYNNIFKIY